MAGRAFVRREGLTSMPLSMQKAQGKGVSHFLIELCGHEGDVVLGGLTPVRTPRGQLENTFERAFSVDTCVNCVRLSGIH